jgi:hypothetical protein
MIKIDMHVHTKYSSDGFIDAEQLIKQCQKKSIDCVCITDHNTIKGALEFKDKVNVKIIIGEEIETGQGEIIGLFLKDEVPSGLSILETIEMIKEQGGLVYIPHPFDGFRKLAIDIIVLKRIVDKIDIIEVFNSRTLFHHANENALRFARENNILPAVGSDAHTEYEVGNSYMEMEDFSTKEEFLKSLKNARLFTQRTPLFGRLRAKTMKILSGMD